MSTHDKVEQLRQSLKAQKEAEALKHSAQGAEISPGLEGQYQNKIAELEKSLQETLANITEFKEKAAKSQDELLRKHAELENFRKRMEREKAEVVKFGHEKMAQELLPVLDGLEKTLEHADKSHDFKSLLEGVELVMRQFLQALEKFGVRVLDAKGQPFNPHEHEAVGHLESIDHPPDSVIHEHRRGYKMHDRLLRPAMVTVSKQPDKEEDH